MDDTTLERRLEGWRKELASLALAAQRERSAGVGLGTADLRQAVQMGLLDFRQVLVGSAVPPPVRLRLETAFSQLLAELDQLECLDIDFAD